MQGHWAPNGLLRPSPAALLPQQGGAGFLPPAGAYPEAQGLQGSLLPCQKWENIHDRGKCQLNYSCLLRQALPGPGWMGGLAAPSSAVYQLLPILPHRETGPLSLRSPHPRLTPGTWLIQSNKQNLCMPDSGILEGSQNDVVLLFRGIEFCLGEQNDHK